MKRVLFFISIFASIAMFAQTTGPVTLSASWTNASGSQSSTMYAYVPTGYSASNTYSLIIGFPGQGWSYQEWGQSDLPSETGELREYMDGSYGNVIVVSPVAPSWPNSLDGFDATNYALDYGIIEAVTQKMSDDYNIGDVYVQGFSVGGRIAVHQAIHSADNVKGLIAHSPAVCDETIEYANSAGLLGCLTAYDQLTFDTGGNVNGGASPGCYGPPGALEKLFWWIAQDIKDQINDNNGDAIFIENANVSHAAPSQTQIHQCWDHVSQFVSTTEPSANFTVDNTSISTGQSVTFTDNSTEGGSAITNWAWTFTGGTPSSFNGVTPSAITYNTAGSYEVSLTVTNSYGSDTETKTGYITVSPVGDAFSLDFELPSNYSQNFAPWSNIDVDGQATYGSSDCDFPGEESAFSFMAFNPTDAGFSLASAHGGQRCGMAICPKDASASNNWLISDKVHIGTGASFDFWVLTPKPGTWGNETYNVLVSTTTDDVSSFTAIASDEDAPISWTQKTYSLASYNGQDIYVAIQHISVDKFMFLIDDIEIVGAATQVEGIENKDISIFPNPTNGNITITNVANSDIIISDINGRILINEVANSDDFNLDLSNLDKGTYIVRILNDSNITIKKIVVR